MRGSVNRSALAMRGDDIGPAVCRAIVAAKLGDVVQVPVELAGVAK